MVESVSPLIVSLSLDYTLHKNNNNDNDNNNLFQSAKAGSGIHYIEAFDLVHHGYLSVAFT